MSTPVIYLTQDQAEAGLAKWKRILRLEDWDIMVSLVPSIDIQRSALGTVSRQNNKQTAHVLLLRSEDWRSVTADGDTAIFPTETWCHEESLVHELIHAHMLLFEPADMDSTEWKLCERFVDTMAKAFVAQDRA
jgi:hypothetical protein